VEVEKGEKTHTPGVILDTAEGMGMSEGGSKETGPE
jgi:hypothetical protein